MFNANSNFENGLGIVDTNYLFKDLKMIPGEF